MFNSFRELLQQLKIAIMDFEPSEECSNHSRDYMINAFARASGWCFASTKGEKNVQFIP